MEFTRAQQHEIITIMDMMNKQKAIYKAQGIELWNDEYPDLENLQEDFDHGFLYVLKDDNQIVASMSQTDSLLEDHHGCESVCYLTRFIVNPDLQNKGYGTIAIAEMENIAIQQKFQRIEFLVSQNNPRAMKLYKHLGFVDIGVVKTPWESNHQCFHRFYKNLK
jgi:ribosomal protein S18 acetylase RimI-like enzyme